MVVPRVPSFHFAICTAVIAAVSWESCRKVIGDHDGALFVDRFQRRGLSATTTARVD